MALILSIDTAAATGIVALAKDGHPLAAKTNDQQKDHAAWIHLAIRDLLEECGYSLQQLDAVAVVAGPGSYTGLRVGMATAKGICYACRVPLITLNTLYIMAWAARQQLSVSGELVEKTLLCPMIDARRMEVFTALYDNDLNEIVSPCALVLELGFFDQWLAEKKIVFFGNGSSKCKSLVSHNGVVLEDLFYSAEHVTLLAQEGFKAGAFTDTAYAEPAYLKDFYTHHKKPAVE
jgi:tRNA threonylcarbamoyladenosine biosynthesis protein TsaB